MAKRKEKVTKVIAGDTFLTRSRRHPVRLANVDAAEKRSKLSLPRSWPKR
jgi:endonuclease YncB( thermonuclease family)